MEYDYQKYKDRKGEWRWRIVHKNGNIIAISPDGYSNKMDCVLIFNRMIAHMIDHVPVLKTVKR